MASSDVHKQSQAKAPNECKICTETTRHFSCTRNVERLSNPFLGIPPRSSKAYDQACVAIPVCSITVEHTFISPHLRSVKVGTDDEKQ